MSRGAAHVARHAAAIIEVRGWGQGCFQADNGNVCIRGAFNSAYRLAPAGAPCFAEIEFSLWLRDLGVLQESPPDGFYGNQLANWNDEPERTQEEVLAYLNKFAEEHDREPALP